MAKKERLGSDPFKESPLNWIQDTREEKKDSKELKTQKAKELKPQSVLASKRLNAKTPKRQNVLSLSGFDVKTSKRQSVLAFKRQDVLMFTYISIDRRRENAFRSKRIK